ncbi:hypothetical protein B0J15DRAFT_249763 [Fusarium solani]|uniref:Uncharacterized protein n=1 Tax=Fusarium solani TaxID=169388 RepID=A0A9P9R522_FUSSL|nr:uncharacterized protein B0J15DRAFT_249763 [Fusarium solani]KAH7266498.1 hypothetical protein B0J15DRAFT_249763 [Fusarium solani]
MGQTRAATTTTGPTKRKANANASDNANASGIDRASRFACACGWDGMGWPVCLVGSGLVSRRSRRCETATCNDSEQGPRKRKTWGTGREARLGSGTSSAGTCRSHTLYTHYCVHSPGPGMHQDCTPRLHSHDFLTPGTPAAKLDKEPCLVSVVRPATKPRHVHSRQKASPTAAFRGMYRPRSTTNSCFTCKLTASPQYHWKKKSTIE